MITDGRRAYCLVMRDFGCPLPGADWASKLVPRGKPLYCRMASVMRLLRNRRLGFAGIGDCRSLGSIDDGRCQLVVFRMQK